MLRPLACAISFLTRIPLPALAWSDDDVGKSAGFFAWVGALIGGLLWAVALLTPLFGERLTALLIVTAWAYVTGGLHLDGLSDAIDGLSGGRGQPARTLEIMRDSRIGSHGALALVLVVLTKAFTWERALSPPAPGPWLFVAPVVARFLCTGLIASVPYARVDGLGSAFRGRVGIGQVALGALPVLGVLAVAGYPALWGALAATVASVALSVRFRVLLSGLTGDVYGAAIELSEAACLLALSLR